MVQVGRLKFAKRIKTHVCVRPQNPKNEGRRIRMECEMIHVGNPQK